MESQDVEYSPISKLPNEMFGHLLSYLPQRSLLRCRLVNRRWKEMSTLACRRNYVEFNYTNRLENQGIFDLTSVPEGVYSLFDMDNLPWSSYNHNPHDPIIQNGDFLDVFGPHFWKWEMSSLTFDRIRRLLTGMPNLVELTWREVGIECFLPPTPNEEFHFQFLNLKRLSIKSSPGTGGFEFMEFVVRNSGAKLNFVQFSIENRSIDAIRSAISLVQSIPSVYLKLGMGNLMKAEVCNLLVGRNFMIRGLHFNLVDENISPGDVKTQEVVWSMAESLVRHFSNNLEELGIEIGVMSGGFAREFKFPPILPKLKTLQITIRFHKIRVAHRLNCASNFLSFLSPENVPNLQKIVLEEMKVTSSGPMERDDEEDRNEEWKTTIFPPGSEFTSVKELTVNGGRNLEIDWRGSFPNTRKLKVLICEEETLETIFKTLPNIKDLNIRMGIKSDNNGVLAGIKEGNPLHHPSSPSENIGIESATPNLLCLKELVSLEIETMNRATRINDTGVALFLLPMQRLEFLKIRGHRISKDFVQKLRDRHLELVLGGFPMDAMFEFLEKQKL